MENETNNNQEELDDFNEEVSLDDDQLTEGFGEFDIEQSSPQSESTHPTPPEEEDEDDSSELGFGTDDTYDTTTDADSFDDEESF